ncbi:AAA-23 domain-containing protein [Fusarium sp. Ph1]|nr:AAA-23 domain-containing protein [Fusarium sp. Ph1]
MEQPSVNSAQNFTSQPITNELTEAVAALGPNEASKTVAFAYLAINKAITQRNKVDLRGSIIYLGSPLQLSWADLYDEQRGVTLFNLETLEHELLINPHAVGYTTADLQQVLGGQVDEGAVMDKHVMLISKLTYLKYITARDKLLSLGVRSVRS